MENIEKQLVEVIQWDGDNEKDVDMFIRKYTLMGISDDNDHGKLLIGYMDIHGKWHKALLPKFGWVVADGDTLHFYKNRTFNKRFGSKETDESKGGDWEGMNKIVGDAFDSFDDIFKNFHDVFGESKQEDKDDKEEEVEPDTFDSVLDEMKELHAKKNSDYGDAFHKSFVEFGPTAAVVRMNDKMERIKSLLKKGKAEVKDESLLDTLKDMSSYAVMLYVELKNQGNLK